MCGPHIVRAINRTSLLIMSFLHNFYSRVRNDDWSAAQLLEEILRIRDDDF